MCVYTMYNININSILIYVNKDILIYTAIIYTFFTYYKYNICGHIYMYTFTHMYNFYVNYFRDK